MKKLFFTASFALSVLAYNPSAHASDGDIVAAAIKAGENITKLCAGGETAVAQVATSYAVRFLTQGKITDVRTAAIDATTAIMAACLGGR